MAEAIIRPGVSFYVYLHRRATDGKVFYVGKGTGRRALKRQSRNPHWNNIVAKHGLVVEYVIDGVQEWYAFELERELIAFYGRDVLCNLTDGGDGVTGMRHTEKSRLAISKAHTGSKRTPEFCAATSARQRGKTISEEQRRAISATLKGRRLPEEVRAKMSSARLGMKFSEERRAALRSSWGGAERRAERGAAMSAASGAATKVRCVDTGQVFQRIKYAEDWLRDVGLLRNSRGGISNCLSGRTKTCCGYRWEYA